jgi:hypothetical protein
VCLIANQGFEVEGIAYLNETRIKLIKESVGTPFNQNTTRTNTNATLLNVYAVNNVLSDATYYPCFRLPLASDNVGASITVLLTYYNPTYRTPAIFTSNADILFDVDGNTSIATSSTAKLVNASMRFISNGICWYRLS